VWTGSFYVSGGDPGRLDYAYGRHGNPTWEALEETLGELEGGAATAFASGQAASFALLMALTADRSRVVLPGDGYYGTRKLARLLAPRGVQPVEVDLADLAAVERALSAEPAVLWAETPTNPFLRVFDMDALGATAERAGARFVVDNTTATPALQRPLEHGALASMISLTKSGCAPCRCASPGSRRARRSSPAGWPPSGACGASTTRAWRARRPRPWRERR
jgi:cystathionine gamma-synthase